MAFAVKPVLRLSLATACKRVSVTSRRLPIRAANVDVGGRTGCGSCAQEYDSTRADATALRACRVQGAYTAHTALTRSASLVNESA
ncbi:hypothetical protein D7S89_25480 [Trinickia fusca]|uniref:Uncharacterized protein n=1 Tax=Trinickia fusca TaxID=2419777 RepID=A0A494X768_9BURK|nr:hypothetical protein D7S89_25480 [Trinickia fusca]